MNHVKDILMRIPSILMYTLLITSCIVAIQYVFYTVTPRAWYFTWFAERAVVAEVGKPLEFTSNREVKETFPIEYIDVVRCGDNDKKLTAKDEKVFNVKLVSKNNDKFFAATTGFTLNDYVPTKPYKNCVLDSKIIMHLPFGIQKAQDIQSDRFDIKE